ncbi:AAA family ATPase [archaeon]|nr:AAA family ATPase [archaeon]
MTKLVKLRLRNFKSFKKADIPLKAGFTAIAGANGSGKCLHGDTLISLADGSQVTIKELNKDNEQVIALNQNLKLVNAFKGKFFSRKVNKLLHVKLKTGKEIKLTPEHPLLTVNGWMPAERLLTGTKIAVVAKEKTKQLMQVIAENGKIIVKEIESDIFWDEIIEATELIGDFEVYDISVPEHHNFVANNIIVHNSNILDSLLFVLGITSMKALRAGKMIDLINHDAMQAEVTIEIESDEEGLTHERKRRYEISRMIDKEGKGACRIDRKKCTLNEIASLLKALKIKPEGYNIVVQGDIARVIEMNPIERRTIIDEIAGIKEFDDKKAEALKELSRVDEKVKDARLVLGEREAYLTKLEKEKNSALKYVELSGELKKCRATIIHQEIEANKKSLREKQAREKQAGKDLEKLNQKKQVLTDEAGLLAKRVEEINSALIAAGERQNELVGKELEGVKAGLKSGSERLEEKKIELSRLDERKEFIAKRVSELGKDKAAKEERLMELNGLIAPLQKEISELEAAEGIE